MIKVYYFSGSGKSRRLAEYFGKKLDSPVLDITKLSPDDYFSETAVVIFPVYCQNLPDAVFDFLPKLKAEKVVFAATYGRKSYGNVIMDASEITNAKIIAGVCVPCGHSFLDEPDDFDFDAFEPIFERIKNPESAVISKAKKVFYADLVPARRTQIGVKLFRNQNCNHCGKCIENCPTGAMEENSIGKNCIRCLRCVNECSQKALDFKTLQFMRIYLCRNRKNELKFYL
ncbi:MAG: 4Fe-4S binding protein [Oscillospiraceae bacterium]|nr:4Fe-4S binding protein [Oscillospiraceae bacterium]